MLGFGAVQDGELRCVDASTYKLDEKKMNSLLCYCLSGSADGLALFSCNPYGKFLFSLGNRGPGKVWDVTSVSVVAFVLKENTKVEVLLHGILTLGRGYAQGKLWTTQGDVAIINSSNLQVWAFVFMLEALLIAFKLQYVALK
ncbi:hypothetical protein Patl1_27673 [Pistacia atlantica]|uniref:Uncharacterized protein n=1 Tax=Pistacia atlantica TaxID=434234 RepID=A0ACC1BBQ0_9ROSI|nr:hypothetical protein Patl1_27673 [Pistacia atlantica]